MKIIPRKKNDRLVQANKEWTIYKGELKKKYEDKKHQVEELKTKYDIEKKSKDENVSKELVKLKNEIEISNKKYKSALNEINKLARWVNLYGKNLPSSMDQRISNIFVRLLENVYSLKNSETRFVPTEICIRGRTIHWLTYTVQQVMFYLDGFNEEGYPIYAGIQKKLIKTAPGLKRKIVFETDSSNYNTIYLTHD